MSTFSFARQVALLAFVTILSVILFASGQGRAAFDVAAHMEDEIAILDRLDAILSGREPLPDDDVPPIDTPTGIDRDGVKDHIVFVRVDPPKDDKKDREVLIRVPSPPPPPPIDPWPEDRIKELEAEVTIPGLGSRQLSIGPSSTGADTEALAEARAAGAEAFEQAKK